MKPIPKIYWKIVNFLSRLVQSLAGGTGLLPHRKDDRDFEYVGTALTDRPKDIVLDKGYRFNQQQFNICVFGSRILGRSEQNGIRLSVRWDVKVARKNGWLTGNGWSYLRAENDLGNKVGCLPYELMPDEINGMSWEEYSKWTPEDELLLQVASHFKIPGYYQVKTRAQAVQALAEGKALFTAGKWFYDMNYPVGPKYLLTPTGGLLGGHAYHYPIYYNWGDEWGTVQTFGVDYGDKGVAYTTSIFAPTQYSFYVEDSLPPESIAFYLTECKQGQVVKGTNPPIYLIYGNQKRAFTNWDSYVLWCAKDAKDPNNFITVKDDALALIPDGELI